MPHQQRDPGTWAVYEGKHGDKPLIARFDTAYKNAQLRGARKVQIGVAVPFRNPTPNGLPDAEDGSALGRIEDAIQTLASDRAVLVGVITTSKMREFVLYAATHDWLPAFHQELRKVGTPHDVQMIGKMDPDWRTYGQFVS
jgi:hypothetical protein